MDEERGERGRERHRKRVREKGKGRERQRQRVRERGKGGRRTETERKIRGERGRRKTETESKREATLTRESKK